MPSSKVLDWQDPFLAAVDGSTVFVLGAGFSRSTHGRMPLTDELGDLCLPIVRDWLPKSGPTRFTGGFFEVYLSALAADQPFLGAAENIENHALFERFSSAIAQVLGDRQQEILAGDPPAWLIGFLMIAHRLKAGVVSFNYDTLLECIIESPFAPLDRFPTGGLASEPFPWAELTGGVPAWPPGHARWDTAPRESLRLLKLHGSLNWYWSPGDISGATVAKRDLPGSWRRPQSYREEDRERELPGRVPFLVPPTATKSSFYSSPQLREFWHQARNRLASASHVFLLGYSLPATDTTTGTMLREALASTASTLVIADVNPEPVAARLTQLGIAEDRIKTMPVGGSEPIPALTGVIAARLSSSILQHLTTAPKGEPLVVSWGNHCYALVRDIVSSGDEVLIVTGHLAASLYEINQLSEPTKETSDLPSGTGSLARLSILLPDGDRQPVVDHTSASFTTGRGLWRILRPSGLSPRLKEF
jgi:hypothetical protein